MADREDVFDKLPAVYKEAINRQIADIQGDESPEIAHAFREYEAEAWLGCEIFEDDVVDVVDEDEIGNELCAFRAGWFARVSTADGILVDLFRLIGEA